MSSPLSNREANNGLWSGIANELRVMRIGLPKSEHNERSGDSGLPCNVGQFYSAIIEMHEYESSSSLSRHLVSPI